MIVGDSWALAGSGFAVKHLDVMALVLVDDRAHDLALAFPRTLDRAMAEKPLGQEVVELVELAAFGGFRATDGGRLSETTTRACCVTLPTMALPPSPTDTFCTVMAGSPWLR